MSGAFGRRRLDGLGERRLEAVAVGALAVAFGLVAGPLGLVAGLVPAAVWYRWGSPYAMGAAAVVFVALTPGGASPLAVALVGGALWGLLLASTADQTRSRRTWLVSATLPPALGGLAWLALREAGTWLAAAAVLTGLGLASYGLHRLGLVRLGLVPADTDTDQP